MNCSSQFVSVLASLLWNIVRSEMHVYKFHISLSMHVVCMDFQKFGLKIGKGVKLVCDFLVSVQVVVWKALGAAL